MLDFQKSEVPSCFGKHWDAKVVMCTGGLDPTFRDPMTGSHVRERCMHFSSCGAKVQATKIQSLIPANQLVRPTTVQPVAAVPQAANLQIQQLMQQNAQLQALLQQQQTNSRFTPTSFVSQAMANLPASQLMPVNYQMPGYLTVPEPRGESLLHTFGRSLVRSLLKSAGHTFAAFWDDTPIGRPPTPQ